MRLVSIFLEIRLGEDFFGKGKYQGKNLICVFVIFEVNAS